MPASIDKQLEKAQKMEQLSSLKLKNELNNRKLELVTSKSPDNVVKTILNKYDALKRNGKRKSSTIESTTEDRLHSNYDWLHGINVGRDLERNSSSFRSLLNQLKVMAVGSGPKIIVQTDDENFNTQYTNWFRNWAHYCDALDDSSFYDFVALSLTASIRDRDILWVFDDFLNNDSTVKIYEADQMPSINKNSWQKAFDEREEKRNFPWTERDKNDARKRVPMLQSDGVVYKRDGTVVAYVVSNKYGQTDANFEDVTILPAWHALKNPDGVAKLFKLPLRPNQARGVGAALNIANNEQDIYEMLSAELQSAKTVAAMAGWVESSEEADSAVVRALERARASGTINDEEMEKILYGDGEQAGIVQGTNYQRIEDLVGGKFEYSDPGDKIHIHESSRPSPQVKDFIDFIQRVSGAAIGLARSRSTMKAETSYTAFRGEELMSWATIEVYQKQLERRLLDFVSYKTINYAIENGEIDPTDSVWIDKISWEWPKMKEVDEGRQVAANQNKLKSGLSTYKQLLGPDWEERFAQFAVELNRAKELGLPLGVFESVSGAIVEETKDNNGSDSDVED